MRCQHKTFPFSGKKFSHLVPRLKVFQQRYKRKLEATANVGGDGI